MTKFHPSVSEKAEKLMIAIEKISKFIGDPVEISYDDNANSWLSISWSQNPKELIYLLEKYLMQEHGWVVDTKEYHLGFSMTVQLAPSGYAYLDQQDLKGVHFDNRQYNFLQWNMNDLPSFKKSLQSRIEATVGVGPVNEIARQ